MEVGEAKQRSIPTWAQSFLSEEDFPKVLEQIRQAESKTQGEIVAVIAKRSSPVGHVPIILVLIWLVLCMSVIIYGEYNRLFESVLNSEMLIFSMIATCLGWIAVYFGSSTMFVQRWLTPASDEIFNVQNRAEKEFFANGLHQTKGQTGVLLFVSLMERRAVVLADRGISTKLEQKTWDEVLGLMISGIKSGKPAEGIVNAVQSAGVLLAKHFPSSGRNQNELADHLIIKE